MHALIAVLPGDGIGTEVTDEALRLLRAVADKFGHTFEFETALIGGASMDATGEPLPEATVALCRRADAVLLGAVGGPKWADPQAKVRPEQGLLGLRKALGLFANLRPVTPHPAVLDASPIKADLLHGVDIMVVRELTAASTSATSTARRPKRPTYAATRCPRSNASCASRRDSPVAAAGA